MHCVSSKSLHCCGVLNGCLSPLRLVWLPTAGTFGGLVVATIETMLLQSHCRVSKLDLRRGATALGAVIEATAAVGYGCARTAERAAVWLCVLAMGQLCQCVLTLLPAAQFVLLDRYSHCCIMPVATTTVCYADVQSSWLRAELSRGGRPR